MDVVRQTKISKPNLSQMVLEAREKDGRSAQVLATKAGISTGYWYQIENGKRKWISEETLRGIEQALNVDFGVKFPICDTPLCIRLSDTARDEFLSDLDNPPEPTETLMQGMKDYWEKKEHDQSNRDRQ